MERNRYTYDFRLIAGMVLEELLVASYTLISALMQTEMHCNECKCHRHRHTFKCKFIHTCKCRLFFCFWRQNKNKINKYLNNLAHTYFIERKLYIPIMKCENFKWMNYLNALRCDQVKWYKDAPSSSTPARQITELLQFLSLNPELAYISVHVSGRQQDSSTLLHNKAKHGMARHKKKKSYLFNNREFTAGDGLVGHGMKLNEFSKIRKWL